MMLVDSFRGRHDLLDSMLRKNNIQRGICFTIMKINTSLSTLQINDIDHQCFSTIKTMMLVLRISTTKI